MSKNVLFVTEGSRDARFLEKLLGQFRKGEKYEVFSYRTSIHELLRGLITDGSIDADLDFLLFLKESKTSVGQEDVLKHKFTDVFLVFDMDPQHHMYDSEKLMIAMEYFGDSTENGKLFLNYPMLESYRHMPNPYDEGYLGLTVGKDQISSNYKGLAASEGSPLLADLAKIDLKLWERIITLNLTKVNVILNSQKTLPDAETYLSFSGRKILETQTRLLNEEEWIYVLNTSLFVVVDYAPKAILEQLKNPDRSSDGH